MDSTTRLIRDLRAGDTVPGLGTVNSIEEIDYDRFRVAWSHNGRIVAATWDGSFPAEGHDPGPGRKEPTMFNVYRAPLHPVHAYSLIGSYDLLSDAVTHLRNVALCVQEDDENPGHFDAISSSGQLYSIVPAGSVWTPSRVISRLEA